MVWQGFVEHLLQVSQFFCSVNFGHDIKFGEEKHPRMFVVVFVGITQCCLFLNSSK